MLLQRNLRLAEHLRERGPGLVQPRQLRQLVARRAAELELLQRRVPRAKRREGGVRLFARVHKPPVHRNLVRELLKRRWGRAKRLRAALEVRVQREQIGTCLVVEKLEVTRAPLLAVPRRRVHQRFAVHAQEKHVLGVRLRADLLGEVLELLDVVLERRERVVRRGVRRERRVLVPLPDVPVRILPAADEARGFLHDAAGAVVHGDDARQRLLLVRGDDVEERTRLPAPGLFFDVVALVLVRRVVHRPEAVHRLGRRDERAAGVVQNRADVRHRGLELHLLVPAQNRRDAKQRRRLLRLRVPVQRARQRPQARLDGVAQRLKHQRVDVLQEVEPLAPNFRGVTREDGPERLLQHILHLRAQIAERLRSLREPSLLRLLELALLVHAFLGERHQALLAHRRALLAHRVHALLERVHLRLDVAHLLQALGHVELQDRFRGRPVHLLQPGRDFLVQRAEAVTEKPTLVRVEAEHHVVVRRHQPDHVLAHHAVLLAAAPQLGADVRDLEVHALEVLRLREAAEELLVEVGAEQRAPDRAFFVFVILVGDGEQPVLQPLPHGGRHLALDVRHPGGVLILGVLLVLRERRVVRQAQRLELAP